MTVKEYTLSDAEDKLNNIAAISMFLNSGACPKEISFNLYDHMHDEIENLQGMLSFMRLYPEIKAQELEQATAQN
ncbi:RstC protein [Vibrio parahaemolyticus]|nr:RstC protein [Vibrio parahaemolyticus]